MEAATYAVEHEIEATHWWFAERRRLFRRELQALRLAPEARILDIGTGTGSNLRLLQEMGFRNVIGLDASPEAVRFCLDKKLGDARIGDISQLPFADGSFELILATDVIEHVDDDGHAVREIARALVPGGRALITVPAFPSLWGVQDEIGMHKRRYRLGAVDRLLRDAGLDVLRRYYFNYLLFVPIWAARQLIQRLGLKVENENNLNNPLINTILGWILRVDTATAPFLHPPFGVSGLLIAGKRA